MVEGQRVNEEGPREYTERSGNECKKSKVGGGGPKAR